VAPYFEDRIFGGHDLLRSKPAPGVCMAAAAHLRADPTRCVVAEDTATGVRARPDAGAIVWGYRPAGLRRAFEGLPMARVFRHMDDLVAALGG
jgi:beta-phosphoglucomutase-like phosphatase (HAD superfamily)